jgi:hypothetical protein
MSRRRYDDTGQQCTANEEPKALERAQATLSTLPPTTPCDDAIAFDLWYASRLMTEAMAKGVPSEKALNELRARASNALSAVAVSLDRRMLTPDMIETARQDIAAVCRQLQA